MPGEFLELGIELLQFTTSADIHAFTHKMAKS